MGSPRLILFHKQATSARTRFLRLAYGGVCAFDPLGANAELISTPPGAVSTHPAAVLRAAAEQLTLPTGSLEHEPGFRYTVRDTQYDTQVLLARFTAIDPPFERAESLGASFIDLTQARGLAPVELHLLQRAYEVILG
jgi:hypothetical protein